MSVANLDYLLTRCTSGKPTAEWRLDLQIIMHTNAGVYRKQDLLAEGCSKLHQLANDMKSNLKVRQSTSEVVSVAMETQTLVMTVHNSTTLWVDVYRF